MQLLPLDPEIKLTFNQPMDTESVESNFRSAARKARWMGEFSWNEEETELTFVPERPVGAQCWLYFERGRGGTARKGGMVLGADYGAVLHHL